MSSTYILFILTFSVYLLHWESFINSKSLPCLFHKCKQHVIAIITILQTLSSLLLLPFTFLFFCYFWSLSWPCPPATITCRKAHKKPWWRWWFCPWYDRGEEVLVSWWFWAFCWRPWSPCRLLFTSSFQSCKVNNISHFSGITKCYDNDI